MIKDIKKMIAAHIEYCDAVNRFADSADWVRVRDRIKELEFDRDSLLNDNVDKLLYIEGQQKRRKKLEAENKRLCEQLKEALTCALDADPIRYAFLYKHLKALEEGA